jgi:DHA1 family purine ribonucleoside efflux pump-like MFS transporter
MSWSGGAVRGDDAPAVDSGTPDGSARAPAAGPEPSKVRWGAFGSVSAAYLAVTVGESILAPLYPAVADDLRLDLGDAGAALGLLTGSIAVANVAGGFLLARRGPKVGVVVALVLAAAGALLATVSRGVAPFLAALVLLGLAAGTFFAPGVHAIGTLGGEHRQGTVMGLFGVAFSAGLTLAALFGWAGAALGWRTAFMAAGVLAVVATMAVALSDLPERRVEPETGARWRLREAIGPATAVGSAAAATQYGTVVFLPVFAVTAWGLEPGTAALLLAAGRALSVPAKTIGGCVSDRIGPLAAAGRVGAVLTVAGLGWLAVPNAWWSAACAVAFVATVGAAFPIANVLAFREFGDRGPLLGAFRSVQMAVGAAVAAAIGASGELVGLRPILLVTLAAPLFLVVLPRVARRGKAGEG